MTVFLPTERLDVLTKGNLSTLSRKVHGRHSLIVVMYLAAFLQEHVLIVGPPGTGKSYLARMFFSQFPGRTFHIVCSERMSEEYLVGPLDMKLFRDEGEYRHKTEGTIVDAEYAFLDEFLDLPDTTARCLLEILNERTFTKGKQKENCPLRSCVAATNFSAESEELQAVQDRFIFRVDLEGLQSQEDIHSALEKTVLNRDDKKLTSLSLSALSKIRQDIESVTLDSFSLEVYSLLVSILKPLDTSITDRRVISCVRVAKAFAFLSGRDIAQIDDFIGAITLCLVRKPSSEISREIGAALTEVKKDFRCRVYHWLVESLSNDCRGKRNGITRMRLRTETTHLRDMIDKDFGASNSTDGARAVLVFDSSYKILEECREKLELVVRELLK